MQTDDEITNLRRIEAKRALVVAVGDEGGAGIFRHALCDYLVRPNTGGRDCQMNRSRRLPLLTRPQ